MKTKSTNVSESGVRFPPQPLLDFQGFTKEWAKSWTGHSRHWLLLVSIVLGFFAAGAGVGACFSVAGAAWWIGNRPGEAVAMFVLFWLGGLSTGWLIWRGSRRLAEFDREERCCGRCSSPSPGSVKEWLGKMPWSVSHELGMDWVRWADLGPASRVFLLARSLQAWAIRVLASEESSVPESGRRELETRNAMANAAIEATQSANA